jgi:ketosteroid isomerase-like protein
MTTFERRSAVTKDEAWNLANHWVAAWNAHDLDMILSHYDDAVELTSPVAAQVFGRWPTQARFWLEWGLFASAHSIPF